MPLFRYASGLLPLALALAWAAPSPAAPADKVSPGVQIVKGAAIADKIDRAAPSPGGRGGVIAEDEGWRVHATKRDAPGEQRGPAIRGGSELAIGAGDLISIRPGVAHWIKAVDGRLRYLTVKVHGRPVPAGRAR